MNMIFHLIYDGNIDSEIGPSLLDRPWLRQWPVTNSWIKTDMFLILGWGFENRLQKDQCTNWFLKYLRLRESSVECQTFVQGKCVK